MAWPTGAVSTTNVDATSDDPELAVVDIKSAFDKLNQIIAHVSTFIQGLLDDADATAARTTLGLGALAVKATIATADIDNDAVTYAKIQNVSATDRLLGRSTAGAGDAEEIVCTAAGRALIDDADAAAQRTTLDVPSNTDLALKAPLASPTFTGTPLETMGTGSGTAALIGKASINTTAVGNVGTGTDVLMSYLLLANSLSANGKGIRVKGWGITALNANSKTLTFNWGSLSHGFVMTASISGNWIWEIEIFRTGSNTQRMFYRIMEATDNNGGLVTPKAAQVCNSTPSQTDTADITVKFTGAATADNDIVQEGMLVEYIG